MFCAIYLWWANCARKKMSRTCNAAICWLNVRQGWVLPSIVTSIIDNYKATAATYSTLCISNELMAKEITCLLPSMHHDWWNWIKMCVTNEDKHVTKITWQLEQRIFLMFISHTDHVLQAALHQALLRQCQRIPTFREDCEVLFFLEFLVKRDRGNAIGVNKNWTQRKIKTICLRWGGACPLRLSGWRSMSALWHRLPSRQP